jgi:hypothetical protein
MSKFAIRVAIFFVIIFGVYIFGAFVSWDFNAGHWSTENRMIFALVGTAFGFLMAVNPYFPEAD